MWGAAVATCTKPSGAVPRGMSVNCVGLLRKGTCVMSALSASLGGLPMKRAGDPGANDD